MTMSMYKRRGARNLVAAILALGFMQAPVTIAETQGGLGQTSTGTVDVHLMTSYLLKISGLEDIYLNWDASKILNGEMNENALTGKIDFCVFTNKYENAQHVYNMSVTSGNGSQSGPGAFRLKGRGENNNTVGYEVYIDEKTVTTYNNAYGKWNATNNGQRIDDFVGGKESNLLDCKGERNSSMWVVANLDDAITAQPDEYSDTLTLTVSAE